MSDTVMETPLAGIEIAGAPQGFRASARVEGLPDFRLAGLMMEARRRGAIDLAIGVPQSPPAPGVREAAVHALESEDQQYADPRGTAVLRRAVAEHLAAWRGVAVDPETEVTVGCGATEAMHATLAALLDPGDEVVLFEPVYENHLSQVLLLGGVPRFVRLRGPGWSFDEADLDAAFSPRTKAVVVNSPHNPTGKVFGRDELEVIAARCERWNAVFVSDDIYEHVAFPGVDYVSPLQVEALRHRAVAVGGPSKSFRVTGWRLGWAVAPPELTRLVRRAHAIMTGGAVGPLQSAAAVALRLGPAYHQAQAEDLRARHARAAAMLAAAGFDPAPVQGGYFGLAGIGRFGFDDDEAFCRHLLEEGNLLLAPGSSFFADPRDGRGWVRFCFAKNDATLDAAEAALRAFAARRQGHARS
jgi:aminotransferase